jgi:hypothetical protein
MISTLNTATTATATTDVKFCDAPLTAFHAHDDVTAVLSAVFSGAEVEVAKDKRLVTALAAIFVKLGGLIMERIVEVNFLAIATSIIAVTATTTAMAFVS